MKYLNFSYSDATLIPVIYRKWFLEKHLSDLKEIQEKSTNKNKGPDFKSLSKFEKKFGIT